MPDARRQTRPRAGFSEPLTRNGSPDQGSPSRFLPAKDSTLRLPAVGIHSSQVLGAEPNPAAGRLLRPRHRWESDPTEEFSSVGRIVYQARGVLTPFGFLPDTGHTTPAEFPRRGPEANPGNRPMAIRLRSLSY